MPECPDDSTSSGPNGIIPRLMSVGGKPAVAQDFADHRAHPGATAGKRRFGRNQDPLRDPAPLIKRVYAYVAYRIGDGADAEDVTSEVFERATRYRATYQPSKGDPVAWLLG